MAEIHRKVQTRSKVIAFKNGASVKRLSKRPCFLIEI